MSEFYRPETIKKIPFKLGMVVMTQGVGEYLKESIKSGNTIYDEISACLFSKHFMCDWGDLPEEDWLMNDSAVLNANDRIFSAYTLSDGEKIWIITEWNRTVTTILFPSEY